MATHPPNATVNGDSGDDPLNSHPACDLTSNATLLTLCASLHRTVTSFLALSTTDPVLLATQAQTRLSLTIIRDALQKYSLTELSLSYNGGKDCLVLLILFLSCLPTLPASRIPPLLNSVYILPPSPFPSVSAFVAHTTRQYHLFLSHYALPMRDAFTLYLAEHPAVRAIMVGTRRTDPHGAKLGYFDPTDGGWPEFMRVHPVLEWRYAEIWCFLRQTGTAYCELYDEGYTSLGGVGDTVRNPALRRDRDKEKAGDEGEGEFRPAYELVDDGMERLGRNR